MINEQLYNKVKRLARDLHNFSKKLDDEIKKEYGFSYSDRDIDEVIDTLDYGTSGLAHKLSNCTFYPTSAHKSEANHDTFDYNSFFKWLSGFQWGYIFLNCLFILMMIFILGELK